MDDYEKAVFEAIGIPMDEARKTMDCGDYDLDIVQQLCIEKKTAEDALRFIEEFNHD